MDKQKKSDDLLGNIGSVNNDQDIENWDEFPNPSADVEFDPNIQDLDPYSPYMKALMHYNEKEIEEFMNGYGVEDKPQFSDDFEARFQESMRKAKPDKFKDPKKEIKSSKMKKFTARVVVIIIIPLIITLILIYFRSF